VFVDRYIQKTKIINKARVARYCNFFDTSSPFMYIEVLWKWVIKLVGTVL